MAQYRTKKKSLEATFLLLCLQESLLVKLWQQLLHHMQQNRRFKDMCKKKIERTIPHH